MAAKATVAAEIESEITFGRRWNRLEVEEEEENDLSCCKSKTTAAKVVRAFDWQKLSTSTSPFTEAAATDVDDFESSEKKIIFHLTNTLLLFLPLVLLDSINPGFQ